MYGSAVKVNLGNVVFSSSSKIILDIVSNAGQGVGNDLLMCNSATFNGGEIECRWNPSFIPQVGQKFLFLQSNQPIQFNRIPTVQPVSMQPPDSRLKEGLDIKLSVGRNQMFIEVVAAVNPG